MFLVPSWAQAIASIFAIFLTAKLYKVIIHIKNNVDTIISYSSKSTVLYSIVLEKIRGVGERILVFGEETTED